MYFYFNDADLDKHGGRVIYSNCDIAEFRPIKTDRENVISWHLNNMGYDSDEFDFSGIEEHLAFVTLSLLYRGGHLTIPESKK